MGTARAYRADGQSSALALCCPRRARQWWNPGAMPPRGLKKVLKDTAPCKLVGSGHKKRFQLVLRGGGRGLAMRGLTKRLECKIFSDGDLPSIATSGTVAPKGGHWRGADGGRRRGCAVDAQVSRLASVSAGKRFDSRMLVLSRLVFSALSHKGLEPVMGQRAVCSQLHRVGTAADVVCYKPDTHTLVIVELKCGFSGCKTAAARDSKGECCMKGPLRRASDHILHRHLAQLALTHSMFMREKTTLKKLGSLGVEGVEGMLLYANDETVETHGLTEWWRGKASSVLDYLR